MNKYQQGQPAILLLADGTVFKGKAAGNIGTTTGELCFNTGMTGYQEIFTDPSYFGQILVTSTSHIGNYGVHPEEIESEELMIAGLVCKKFSKPYSRASASASIQTYFENHNLIGISDVDTRAIVRKIRDEGAMNAVISSDGTDIAKLQEMLDKAPSMAGLELSSKVSTEQEYFLGDENARYRVAVLDFGVKKNILRCLNERDCYLKVYPVHASFEEIKAWNPDGIMLSNGPGDPSSMPKVIATAKEIINSGIPTFGICLGHQIIALAADLSTQKMHNGHRGVNHPVKNLATGNCEVTSQNHGFVVNYDDAINNENIEVTHIHLNDHTLAGIKLKDQNVFSVQFHPEASAGPNDSRYLFDEFIENIAKNKPKLVPAEKIDKTNGADIQKP
ncbi:MAG: glutamine-hydrolyzing carbamoyl-phosphate synthase small subunit [Flavobacteriales bacterium]|nr:glutamine-hydrolyzing carbamoyl-phosphate synthase small subunit [Flavobacteriales bacterium]